MAWIEGGDAAADTPCVFCSLPGAPDAEALVLARGEAAYVALNRYPYSNGHLVVLPYRHEPDWAALTADELADIGRLTQTGIRVLRDAYGAEAFNIGVNQGRPAGAGIPGHVHEHVVPRWSGDTNFMTVVAEARVIPEELSVTWSRLRSGFDAAYGAARATA